MERPGTGEAATPRIGLSLILSVDLSADLAGLSGFAAAGSGAAAVLSVLLGVSFVASFGASLALIEPVASASGCDPLDRAVAPFCLSWLSSNRTRCSMASSFFNSAWFVGSLAAAWGGEAPSSTAKAVSQPVPRNAAPAISIA